MFDSFDSFDTSDETINKSTTEIKENGVFDLSNLDFIADLEDSTTEELSEESEKQNEIIEQLQELDYQGLYNLELEELEQLQAHASVCADTESSSNGLKDLLENTLLESTRRALQNSVALISGKNNSNIRLDKIAPKNVPDSIDAEVRSIILSLIVNHLTENRNECTPNDIINVLEKNGYVPRETLSLNQNDYISYLSSAITEVKALRERIRRADGVEALRRESNIQYLLNEEESKIVEAKKHELACIKQIFFNGADYYCDCPTCGNRVKLNSVAANYYVYAVYDSESFNSYTETNYSRRSNKNAIFPSITYCNNCNTGVMLSSFEIMTVWKYLQTFMKNGADKFAQLSSQFAIGTACTKTIIPMSMLSSTLNYLIYYEEEPVQRKIVDKTNTEQINDVAEVNVDFIEIKNAAIQFYNKLIGKRQNSNTTNLNIDNETFTDSADDDDEIVVTNVFHTLNTEEHLTYHEIAINLAENLSKDYNRLKHQALFSLIFVLNENIHTRAMLNTGKLHMLSNYCKFIDSLPMNESGLSPQEAVDIRIEYSKRYPESKVSLQEMLSTLKANIDKDLLELESIKEYRRLFFKELQDNVDTLAYLKIINLNQVKISQLYDLLYDDENIDFLNQLTDRMIITNLSEEFYDVYIRTGVFNSVTLKKVNSSADVTKVATSLQNTFSKVSENYAAMKGYLPVINDNIIANCFSRVTEMSSKRLQIIKEVYDLFRGNDFYHFVKAVNDLKLIDRGTLSSTFYDKLTSLIKFNEDNYNKLKDISYSRFYLSEFSEQEFNDTDQNTRNAINRLTFGLLVPKRLENESLKEFVERYTSLKDSNTLSSADSYDYYEEFNSYAPFFSTIILCAGVSGVSYNVYTRAAL